MILVFCFNNLLEVLKKFFGPNGVMMSIIIIDISKALQWNLIEQFIKPENCSSSCRDLTMTFTLMQNLVTELL